MTFIDSQGLATPGTFTLRGGQPSWATGPAALAQPLSGGYNGSYGAGAALDLHPFDATAAASAPQTVLTPYQATPDVEARAASGFLQDACADLIRKLYHYIEANQQVPQLLDCVPLVQHAAELYGARDYTSAFSQAYQAYRAVAILQATVPGLPSLS